MEEMASIDGGLYNPGAGVFGRTPPPVIWGGTEEQIQKYVARTLKDATYTFFAITEPSGGSDPAGVDPMPRRSQRRPLRAQRPENFHFPRS